jgi:phage repressor protein C with HTH and peptisase S24 domain
MIVDRILQLIKYKGINRRKFYIETGFSNGFLDKVKDIGVSKLEHILKVYPDINPEWLLTGNGNMTLKKFSFEYEPDIKTFHLQDSDAIYELKHDIRLQKQQVPLYDIQTPAGIISLFKDSAQEPVDYISVPNLSKCDGAIYINGDSMHPLLKTGDIITYKKINNTIDNIFWGEMYLVSLTTDDVEEFIMTKWIQKSDKGDDWIKLVSENPKYEPKEIRFENVKGLAIIKASIRVITTH